MQAFSQDLTAIYDRVDVVRVGPNTVQMGDPWDYILVAGSNSAVPGQCWLIGLKSDGDFSTAHRRAIGDELHRRGFTDIRWDRIKRWGKVTRTAT